jgi:hypothetical protein
VHIAAMRRQLGVPGFSAPPADRSPRPVPDSPPRPDGGRGGNPVGTVRSGPQRQGLHDRRVDLPGLGRRRGAVSCRTARSGALPYRAAAVRDHQPEHRTRGATYLSALRDRHAGLESARPGAAHRPLPQGQADRHPRRRHHAAALQRRAQARCGRTARAARREGRPADDPPRDGLWWPSFSCMAYSAAFSRGSADAWYQRGAVGLRLKPLQMASTRRTSRSRSSTVGWPGSGVTSRARAARSRQRIADRH